MPANQIQQESGRWPVALVGDLMQNGLVRFIVEVERIVRKNRVVPQTKRLVHLKIKADGNHEINATCHTTIGGWDRMIHST